MSTSAVIDQGLDATGFMYGYPYTVRVRLATPVGPFTMTARAAAPYDDDELEPDSALGAYLIHRARRELAKQPITALTFPG